MKIACAVAGLFVLAFSCEAEAQFGPPVRWYGPMPGGTCEATSIAYSNRVSIEYWRFLLYNPRPCVYTIPELGRTFEFKMVEVGEIEEVNGRVIRRTVFTPIHTENGFTVKNSWVMPAGIFPVALSETGPGIVYGTGIAGEPEKWVNTEFGVRHFFLGFVLVDGKVYSPWCEILPTTIQVPVPEPTPELLPPQPIPQRRTNPEYSPEAFPVPPAPTPALPTLPAPAGIRRDEVKEEEESDAIPFREGPVAMLPRTEITR